MFTALTKDTYHELLTCSWAYFFWVLLLLFIGLNVVFSATFILFEGSFIIPSHLKDYPHFVSGLFLSIQTMSTIGYGGMLPTSLAGELIAAFESLIGLMFTALSTGLIFTRLSRPHAKIIFADSFLYTETDMGLSLVFRVANTRGNDIINAQATLCVIDLSQRSSRLNLISIRDLKLRRSSTPAFYLNWIVIHDLNEESPLSDYTLEALSNPNLVYILNITGHDSSFNQTVFQYKRYTGEVIRAHMYFSDMIITDHKTGKTQICIDRLSELKAPSPLVQVEDQSIHKVNR